MAPLPLIRPAEDRDWPEIAALLGAAFPDEALAPLVRALTGIEDRVFTLTAIAHGRVSGLAVVTLCGPETDPAQVALLGPLGVSPECQRQGLGRTLVEAACRRLASSGTSRLLVLGDPAYYGRLGFAPETAIRPPYPLPEAWRTAWQSRPIGRNGPAGDAIELPAPWLDPALWSP